MQYYYIECVNCAPDEPVKHFYEVDAKGGLLRAIEEYGDGSRLWDAVAEYKEDGEVHKRGSLLEMPYSEIVWDEEPADLSASQDELMIEHDMEAAEFEAVYADAVEAGSRVEW